MVGCLSSAAKMERGGESKRERERERVVDYLL